MLRNHSIGWSVASVFTCVGLIRQSIGPAIRVSERGSHGCFCAAITAVAHGRLHAGLAHRHHVRAGPEVLQHLDQVVDIVLEPEPSLRQRHFARIAPVGDVDVMILQHRLHGVAQESREVSRQRSDQQHFRLRRVDILPEVQQAAERQVQRRLLDDQRFLVLDHHRLDAEGLRDVRQLGAGRHLQSCHNLRWQPANPPSRSVPIASAAQRARQRETAPKPASGPRKCGTTYLGALYS